MANLTVFVACTLVILLFVDTSRAAVGDATCGAAEAGKEECKNIVNAECDSSGSPECKCKDGITEAATTPTCPLELEGNCPNTDLKCTTEHAECNAAKKCACKSDYKPNGDNTACLQKALEDACSADTDCQHEPNAVCTNNKCSCADGYIQEGNACKKVHGSSCSDTNSCPGLSNSICAGGSCDCAQFFEVENNVCVPVTVTDIDCSVTGNEDCPENAVCADNTNCECDVGFELDGNKCAESGASSTNVMIGMVFSSLLILLVDKLLM